MPAPQERLWGMTPIDIGQEDNGKEKEAPPLPLAIFIDDEVGLVDAWQSCMRVPGCATLEPNISHELSDKEAQAEMIAYLDGITLEQCQRARLVVIDQFRLLDDLILAATRFVSRLREVNKTAWVIETSAYPTKMVYPETNEALNVMETFERTRFIETLLPIAVVRLQGFQHFANDAFVEAAYADPNNRKKFGSRLDSEEDRVLSCQQLLYADQADFLFDAVGNNDKKALLSQFKQMSESDQLIFLHTGWMTEFHLEIGHDAAFYSGSLKQLQNLLAKTDTEQKT